MIGIDYALLISKNMSQQLITINQKTFTELCSAINAAKDWMATQAPGSDWANSVRAKLNDAQNSVEYAPRIWTDAFDTGGRFIVTNNENTRVETNDINTAIDCLKSL